MCGIFAYSGKENASHVILNGLKRLEYRGYDSWGIGVESNSEIKIVKKVGKISDISSNDLNLPVSNTGIGHIRWATHGAVTVQNAHPHSSLDSSFILAQNGIVQNYEVLKKDLLAKGYSFISQTDTEVIVKLIELELKSENDFKKAVRNVFLKLEGRNTIIILRNNSEIYAARNGSPLVIGLNDKDVFFSSDALSFSDLADKMIFVDNNQMVHFDNQIKIYDIPNDLQIDYKTENIDIVSSKVDKENYDHYMIKEIHEAPYVIRQVIKQDYNDIEKLASAIKSSRYVFTIGSGSTGVAAAQLAYYLRSYSKINAVPAVGAEAIEYLDIINEKDIVIVLSQSGETADVLEILEILKTKNVPIASFVNMPGSTISRLSNFTFMSNCGPEICVVSTKVFVAQIAWSYLLSKTVEDKYDEGISNLNDLSKVLTAFLNDKFNVENIKSLAASLKQKDNIFLIAKGQNLQMIKEGMVKLIETAYKHTLAIAAGDLKHYAITLIEEGVPVIAVVSEDSNKLDVLNAVSQVKARGAYVIGIASENYNGFDLFIPVPNTGQTSAIVNVVSLQLLNYYLSLLLGNSIDMPRNIAKSSTVK